MTIRWLEEAKREFHEAVVWYADRNPSLASQFIEELDAVVAQLEKFPESAPRVGSRCRSALLSGFPYAVVYWTDGEILQVVAVAHLKRRPRFWTGRIRKV